MDGLVGKEVPPANFWLDVALTHIGAFCRRQPLGELARRLDPIKVHIGTRADQIAETVVIDAQPVDLVEAARPVRQKWLPSLGFRGEWLRAFLLPGRSIRLHGHVRERVIAVVRLQLDLVDWSVIRALALSTKRSIGMEVAVWRSVQLHRVAFQRMSRELFDIDLGGRGQSLRTQHIIAQWRPIRAATQRQPVLHACLVRSDQWWRVLDRRVWSREMGDAYLASHRCFLRNAELSSAIPTPAETQGQVPRYRWNPLLMLTGTFWAIFGR